MIYLTDQVGIGWIPGYFVDQHILEKDKKAQQDAEDSNNKSSNSGTGKMVLFPGKPCAQSRRSSEYDLNWRIKPAEDGEDAEKKAGPRESVGGGAFGAGVLFHVNSSVGRDKITFLIITRKQKSLKGES